MSKTAKIFKLDNPGYVVYQYWVRIASAMNSKRLMEDLENGD